MEKQSIKEEASAKDQATFKSRSRAALTDQNLQQALTAIGKGFVKKRQNAIDNCPDFKALSDEAVAIKTHTLQNSRHYLTQFESALKKAGGWLHYASTPDDARKVITTIAHEAGAKTIVKGKTMVGEEIDLLEHLTGEGFECTETDLGEYLIQLRGERPSHIIAPALHLTRGQIRKDFQNHHKAFYKNKDAARPLETPEDFVKEARSVLREKFLNADLGITGANLLIAESGASIIVTNEGNGDLCRTLPKTHIVITSFEKLVPTFNDAAVILRLLARSATGQPISTYTTLTSGPNLHKGQAMHVVLLDNGRSEMLASEFSEMLRCIRCGACLNHCPIYQNIGGHAYGEIYPGPMGAVLSPHFFGQRASELPFASTFCGRCNEVCPMQIPLTNLMRRWRQSTAAAESWHQTAGMKLWAWFAARPKLYNFMVKTTWPLVRRLVNHPVLGPKLPLLNKWAQHRAPLQLAAQSFQAELKQSVTRNGANHETQ